MDLFACCWLLGFGTFFFGMIFGMYLRNGESIKYNMLIMENLVLKMKIDELKEDLDE